MKKVTGYTGFNGSDPSEQEGNYLVLDFATSPWPTAVSVKLEGSKKGEVPLSEDDNYCVFRITDKDSQFITVKLTKGEDVRSRVYSLKGLTLNQE